MSQERGTHTTHPSLTRVGVYPTTMDLDPSLQVCVCVQTKHFIHEHPHAHILTYFYVHATTFIIYFSFIFYLHHVKSPFQGWILGPPTPTH